MGMRERSTILARNKASAAESHTGASKTVQDDKSKITLRLAVVDKQTQGGQTNKHWPVPQSMARYASRLAAKAPNELPASRA